MRIRFNSLVKLIFLLFILAPFFSITLQAQDVVLYTQADVDAMDPLMITVNGNLLILRDDSLPPITDLSNLATIRSVQGDVEIKDQRVLISLDGLEGLNSIGGKLVVLNNYDLVNIDALRNLNSIGERLEINNNDFLISIAGLVGLTQINGELKIWDNTNLLTLNGLQGVRDIKGTFKLVGNYSLTNIDELTDLRSIGNTLEIWQSGMLENLNGLSNIDTLKENLIIAYNESLSNIDGLASLKHIGGYANLDNNENLNNIDGFSSLSSVGEYFIISNNNLIKNVDSLINLRSLLELYIGSSPSLLNLDGLINLEYLDFLEIYSNPRLESISGLSNLKTIRKSLNFEDNDKIEGLDGLSNVSSNLRSITIRDNESLKNLNGLKDVLSVEYSINIDSNPELEDITALSSYSNNLGGISIINNPALASIDFSSNIDTIFSFRVHDNTSLKFINGISNLKFVHSSFIVSQNPNLEQISLPNLRTVSSFLSILGNEKLEILEGFDKLDSVGRALSIYCNTRLQMCCNLQPILLKHLSKNGEINIYNNDEGCSSSEDILDNCRAFINGEVYYDFNENGIQESNEFGVPNIEVAFTDAMVLLTNAKGNYYRLPEIDIEYNYTIRNEENQWKLTTIPITYTSLFDIYDITTTSNDFGIVRNEEVSTGNTSISVQNNRCNEVNTFFLRFINKGTALESGELTFQFDERNTYLASSPAMELNGQLLTFRFDSLYPYQVVDIEVQLNGASELETGELLDYKSELYYDDVGNDLVLKDSFNYELIVRCSYDPNDKLVSPVGVDDNKFTLKNTELSYTIRFQNTGNASARDVRILDTLSTFLDLETFEVSNSSFPVYTSIDGNAVEFYFKDIFLIDSLSDPEGSQGFIQYKIKAKEGIPEETLIENTAHIIFDFNPAIITNTTLNTMVTTLPGGPVSVDESLLGHAVKIYPNPSSSHFIVESDKEKITILELYDLSGNLIRTIPVFDFKYQVDAKHLKAGVYILKVNSYSGAQSISKLVKY